MLAQNDGKVETSLILVSIQTAKCTTPPSKCHFRFRKVFPRRADASLRFYNIFEPKKEIRLNMRVVTLLHISLHPPLPFFTARSNPSPHPY